MEINETIRKTNEKVNEIESKGTIKRKLNQDKLDALEKDLSNKLNDFANK